MHTVKTKEFSKEKKDILGICNDSESLRRGEKSGFCKKKKNVFCFFCNVYLLPKFIFALPLAAQALFRVEVTDL